MIYLRNTISMCFMFFFLVSCNQDEITNQEGIQNSNELLIESLAQDMKLKEFIDNTLEFTKQYEEWRNNLPQAELNAYHEKFMSSETAQSAVNYDFISKENLKKYREKQKKLLEEIKIKYPKLTRFSIEEQFDIVHESVGKLRDRSYNNLRTSENGIDCHWMFSECSFDCLNQPDFDSCEHGCWSSYQFCLEHQDPGFQP